jgi:hypothetical protein
VIATILFVASIAALGQFALYYWRAVLAGVAAQPLSERMIEASGLAADTVGPADWGAIMNIHDMTPGLREHNEGLRLVRLYYGALKGLNGLASSRLPNVAGWVNREMETCSRYVAVLLDRRLTANLECAAELRSL